MKKEELGILIGMNRIVNHLNRQTGRLAREEGLTLSQFSVLEVLYSKGELSVGQVKEKALSSTGTIPVIVENLVKGGYVVRRAHERDKRVSLLSLTEMGREKVERVLPKNFDMIHREMNALTRKEQIELLSLLKKLGGRV